MPTLAEPAHLTLHVVREILADLFARALVVDANEGGVVAIRNACVYRNDRDAGFLGRRDCRLHAVDVDRNKDDAVDLLGDVVLDRAVLRRRLIVGIEDNELGSRLVGGLLGAVVDLVEEQRLLINCHQGHRLRRRGDCAEGAGQDCRRKTQVLHHSFHFTLPCKADKERNAPARHSRSLQLDENALSNKPAPFASTGQQC